MIRSSVYVGTAGWSIPKAVQQQFPADGTHLERYSARFDAVEINSSFYRSHRAATYARWAESVPDDFRFSVKLPKTITHERKLQSVPPLLDSFLGECRALGRKLGCILVQLPPRLQFDMDISRGFFSELRGRYDGPVACEPRNVTWFTRGADTLLREFCVARVAAEPAKAAPEAAHPGGWPGLIYYRLHGSPRMYYSQYEDAYLAKLATEVLHGSQRNAAVWCIFDNTTLGYATRDALVVSSRV